MKYKKAIMAVAAAAVVLPLAVLSAGKAGYVGEATCATCHEKEAAAYAKTPHVKALDTLKANGADANAECLACHVTGWDGAKFTDGAVTCEACHGPGADHVNATPETAKTTIKASGEAECRVCHTADWSPKFDYAVYKVKGTHAG